MSAAMIANSGREVDLFSDDEVASQPVAGRVDWCDGEVVCRLGTGVPVTRQRWTAAAGKELRSGGPEIELIAGRAAGEAAVDVPL